MIYSQGRQLCKKCFFLSLLKKVYSKRKEFAPNGSKFFPFRVDHFSEGAGVQKSDQEVMKDVSLVKHGKKSDISSSLKVNNVNRHIKPNLSNQKEAVSAKRRVVSQSCISIQKFKWNYSGNALITKHSSFEAPKEERWGTIKDKPNV